MTANRSQTDADLDPPDLLQLLRQVSLDVGRDDALRETGRMMAALDGSFMTDGAAFEPRPGTVGQRADDAGVTPRAARQVEPVAVQEPRRDRKVGAAPQTDDSDLEQDLAQTERQLDRLLSAPCWNPTQRKTIEQQIAACRRHLVVQRANVVSSWFGIAAETALEHGDALKPGRT